MDPFRGDSLTRKLDEMEKRKEKKKGKEREEEETAEREGGMKREENCEVRLNSTVHAHTLRLLPCRSEQKPMPPQRPQASVSYPLPAPNPCLPATQVPLTTAPPGKPTRSQALC